MTTFIVFLIVICLLLLAILLRILRVELFRKYLKKGEGVIFYIAEEKLFGIVKRSSPHEALIEYYEDEFPSYIVLSKSNLYPGW